MFCNQGKGLSLARSYQPPACQRRVLHPCGNQDPLGLLSLFASHLTVLAGYYCRPYHLGSLWLMSAGVSQLEAPASDWRWSLGYSPSFCPALVTHPAPWHSSLRMTPLPSCNWGRFLPSLQWRNCFLTFSWVVLLMPLKVKCQ